MAWVSYTQFLSDLKDAMADRRMESFFQSRIENNREMSTEYTKLGNMTAFIEWLESKASEETSGLSSGQITSAIGGY